MFALFVSKGGEQSGKSRVFCSVYCILVAGKSGFVSTVYGFAHIWKYSGWCSKNLLDKRALAFKRTATRWIPKPWRVFKFPEKRVCGAALFRARESPRYGRGRV